MNTKSAFSNEKSRLCRDALQEYRNRDYVLSNVDDGIFDTFNDGYTQFCGFLIVTGGCLDALDHIPAGSMKSISDHWFDASNVHREIDAKQQQLIDEMFKDF